MTRTVVGLLLALLAAPVAADQPTAEQLASQALTHLAQNRFAEALQAAEAAVAANPNLAAAQFALGMAARKQGSQNAKIEPALRRAVELEPSNTTYHWELGSWLKSQKRWDEALAEMRRAAELAPNSTYYASGAGELATSLSRWPEAEAMYRQCAAAAPGNVAYLTRAGDAAWRQGQTEEAEALYQQALDAADKADMIGSLAQQAAARHLWPVAGRAASRLLDQYGTLAVAHNLVGLSLEGQGRLAPAELAYRRTLELAPGEATVLTNLGRLLRKTGRLPESEQYLRQAVTTNPKLADAQNELALTLSQDGRHAEALAPAAEAAKLEPGNAIVQVNYGQILLNNNQFAEAETVLRKALTITGPNPDVQKLLDQAVAGKTTP